MNAPCGHLSNFVRAASAHHTRLNFFYFLIGGADDIHTHKVHPLSTQTKRELARFFTAPGCKLDTQPQLMIVCEKCDTTFYRALLSKSAKSSLKSHPESEAWFCADCSGESLASSSSFAPFSSARRGEARAHGSCSTGHGVSAGVDTSARVDNHARRGSREGDAGSNGGHRDADGFGLRVQSESATRRTRSGRSSGPNVASLKLIGAAVQGKLKKVRELLAKDCAARAADTAVGAANLIDMLAPDGDGDSVYMSPHVSNLCSTSPQHLLYILCNTFSASFVVMDH